MTFPLSSNEEMVEILEEKWALIEIEHSPTGRKKEMVIGHVCSKSSEVRLLSDEYKCDQCYEFLPDSLKFLALSLGLT